MGCQLSTPEEKDPMTIGKSEHRRERKTGIGHPERMLSAMERKMIQQSISNKNRGTATVSLEVDEDIATSMPKLNADGHLVPEEIVRRTSSSLNVSTISIGNKEKAGKVISVQYAYRSQRGYYPDDPMKANQDKYGVTLNFAGEDGDAIFSVYDGHGTEGQHCASFAQEKLPQLLAKHVRQIRVKRYQEQLKAEGKPTKGAWNPTHWPLLDKKDFEDCCRKAFLETNKAMHTSKNVEDKLSGTTAATVCFHGGRMTVCNVGDSRVVLGHRVRSQLVSKEEEAKEEEKVDIEGEIMGDEKISTESDDIIAIPLTRDQTPHRRDERERVRKEGAEIKSIDQLSGMKPMHDNWGDMVLGERVDIQGDPPRVWVQGGDYPGTAFTRSLGDKIAENIGVTAEPEIITTNLTENDKFLIIASDGIFEFLTNQYVVNLCATAASPLEACELLTKAAYDQWLTYENRTDDITVIVCFLSSNYKPSSEEEPDTTEALVATAGDMYGTKPLRSMITPSGDLSPKSLNVETNSNSIGNVDSASA